MSRTMRISIAFVLTVLALGLMAVSVAPALMQGASG